MSPAPIVLIFWFGSQTTVLNFGLGSQTTEFTFGLGSSTTVLNFGFGSRTIVVTSQRSDSSNVSFGRIRQIANYTLETSLLKN